MSSNYLYYGDQVYLNLDDSVISANGFYDHDVFLVSTKNIALRSFKNCLFQLYPCLPEKDIQNMQNALNHLQFLKGLLGSSHEAKEKELEKDIQNQKEVIKIEEVKLKPLNDKLMLERIGQPVKYGDSVQLLHIESNTFLKSSNKPYKYDNGLTAIKLKNKSSKYSQFEVLPANSSIQIDPYVIYNESIRFISKRTKQIFTKGRQLHPTTDQIDGETLILDMNPVTNKFTHDDEELPVILPRRREPICDSEVVWALGTTPETSNSLFSFKCYASCKTLKEVEDSKAILVGDYIRISVDRFYLTTYQNETPDKLRVFFQRHDNPKFDYPYNYLNTIYQLIEVTNTDDLPTARTIEICYDEQEHQGKKYVLKHFCSGKFFTAKPNGKLDFNLEKIDTIDLFDETHKFELADKMDLQTHNKTLIDGMSAEFKLKKEGKELALQLGNDEGATKANHDYNGTYVWGFKFLIDFLDGYLRLVKNGAKLKEKSLETESKCKVSKISKDEMLKILEVESFMNQMTKFIDFVFTLKETPLKMQILNRQMKIHNEILVEFLNNFGSKASFRSINEDLDNQKTPMNGVIADPIKQLLMREFNLILLFGSYFVYFIKTRSLALRIEKIEALKNLKPEEAKNEDAAKNQIEENKSAEPIRQEEAKTEEEKNPDEETKVEEEKKSEDKAGDLEKSKNQEDNTQAKEFENTQQIITDKTEEKPLATAPINENISDDSDEKFDFETYTEFMEKMIELYIKSTLNQPLTSIYNAQFSRIPVYSLADSEIPACSFAKTGEYKTRIKNAILKLAKVIHVDEGLGQLEYYGEEIFGSIDKQTSFKNYYLELLTHVFNAKTPNFNNDLATEFIKKYVQNQDNGKYVFPQLIRVNTELKLIFMRKAENIKYEKTISELINKSNDNLKNDELLSYLISSLRFMISLTNKNSISYTQYIIKNSKLTDLEELSNQCQNHNKLIPILIQELIAKIHKQYLSLAFEKIPPTIQFNLENEEINEKLKAVIETIHNEYDKVIDKDEKEKIEKDGITNDVYNLHQQKKHQSTSYSLDNDLPILESYNVDLCLEKIKSILSIYDNKIEYRTLMKLHKVCLTIIKNISSNQDDNIALLPDYLDLLQRIEDLIVQIASFETLTLIKPTSINQALAGKLAAQEEVDLPKDNQISLKAGPTSKNDQVIASIQNTLQKQLNSWKIISSKSESTIVQDSIDSLLNIVNLNNLLLNKKVFKNLQKLTKFDTRFIKELQKAVIIMNQQEANQIFDLFSCALEVNRHARNFKFCLESEVTFEESNLNQALNNLFDTLKTVLLTIYDVNLHWRYNNLNNNDDDNDANQDPKQKFLDKYIEAKREPWDIPFLINPKAIRKDYQKVFTALDFYKPLCNLITSGLQLMEKYKNYKVSIRYVIRTINIILALWAYENKHNQNIISRHREFIRKIYSQAYIDSSVDYDLVFGAMMRNNKKLLSLDIKYLYDTVYHTFIGTNKQELRIANASGVSTYHLATIMVSSYLAQVKLPLDVWNQMENIRTKLTQISKMTDNLKNLNILKLIDEDKHAIKIGNTSLKVPIIYLILNEYFKILREIIIIYMEDENKIIEIQKMLTSPEWAKILAHPNTIFLFEFKNELVKAIMYLNYSIRQKGAIIKTNEDVLNFIVPLLGDLMNYTEYSYKKSNVSSLLDTQSINASFADKSETLANMNKLYESLIGIDIPLNDIKLQVYLEDIAITDLWNDYIYQGCIDFVMKMILHEPEHFCQIIDQNKNTKLIDVTLQIIEDFCYVSIHAQKDIQKILEYLQKASMLKSYYEYKERFTKIINMPMTYQNQIEQKDESEEKVSVEQVNIDIIENIPNKEQQDETIAELSDKKTVENMKNSQDMTEAFLQIIKKLKASKSTIKDERITQLALCISKHQKNKEIISNMIFLLRQDIGGGGLELSFSKFIFKLLRMNIELEYTKNPQANPVYSWDQTASSSTSLDNIKNIINIQNDYRKLGLTSILVKYLLNATDRSLLREALLLAVAYTYNTDETIQKEFYDILVTDSGNLLIDKLKTELTRGFTSMLNFEINRTRILYEKNQGNFLNAWSNTILDANMLQKIYNEEFILNLKSRNPPNFSKESINDNQNLLFILILTFIQSLCQTQFIPLQQFFRVQSFRGYRFSKQFDILEFLRNSFCDYYPYCNKYNLIIGIKILDLMKTICQYNINENIKTLIDDTFILSCSRSLTDFNEEFHAVSRGFDISSPAHLHYQAFKERIIHLSKKILEFNDKGNIIEAEKNSYLKDLLNAIEHNH